jgi:hypothetical protein
VKLGVVSNFDTRLRPLLRALNCDNWFDAMAVSAEVRRSISSWLYVVLFLSYAWAMGVACVCCTYVLAGVKLVFLHLMNLI